MWALFAGFVFAWGLGLGGMTQPDRVRAFLDVFGAWDPTLAFVMAGAVGVFALVVRWVREPSDPRPITPSLVLGAALFGIGWGLSGLCPGPALLALATLHPSALAFVLAMGVGLLLAPYLVRRPSRPASALVAEDPRAA